MSTGNVSPPKQEFANRKAMVYNAKGELIARAKSTTMARRISEALNRHTPNRKGY